MTGEGVVRPRCETHCLLICGAYVVACLAAVHTAIVTLGWFLCGTLWGHLLWHVR